MLCWRMIKEFAKNMKAAYTAPTKDAALAFLNDFEQKRDKTFKYDNWY